MLKCAFAVVAVWLLIATSGCGGMGTTSQGAQTLGQGQSTTGDDGSANLTPPPPEQPNGAVPTPPSNAAIIAHIEQMGNWESCNTKDCSGGSGAGEYWMAANQSSPSLDGASLELHNSGI